MILAVVTTGAGAKLLAIVARAAPPLPASCGFMRRWAYNFIQGLAENQDKVDLPPAPEITSPTKQNL